MSEGQINKEIMETYVRTVEDTFEKFKFNIPEFQRPYVWDEHEINKLIDDIYMHLNGSGGKCYSENNNPLYYLGSIILFSKDENEYEIIDGQQRIITMGIFQFIKGENVGLSLKNPSAKTTKQIKNVYKYLKENCDKVEKMKYIELDKIHFTIVTTKEKDLAFEFFETQNNRGKELGPSNILKAHHLRAIQERNTMEDNAKKWEELENDLDSKVDSVGDEAVDEILFNLLKIRRWNYFDLSYSKNFPSSREKNKKKKKIISEFKDGCGDKKEDAAFFVVKVSSPENASKQKIEVPSKMHSIRQPLNEGINFISYLLSYGDLYYKIIQKQTETEEETSGGKVWGFHENLVKKIDGISHNKDFYELTMMAYLSKFGSENSEKIFEASLWFFWFTYSLRLLKQKVFERSVIKYYKDTGYVFDLIFKSFTHEQLIAEIKEKLPSKIREKNSSEVEESIVEEETVRSRFWRRVKEIFGNGSKETETICFFRELIENKVKEEKSDQKKPEVKT